MKLGKTLEPWGSDEVQSGGQKSPKKNWRQEFWGGKKPKNIEDLFSSQAFEGIKICTQSRTLNSNLASDVETTGHMVVNHYSDSRVMGFEQERLLPNTFSILNICTFTTLLTVSYTDKILPPSLHDLGRKEK